MSALSFSPSKPLFHEAFTQNSAQLRTITQITMFVAGIAALSLSAHVKIPFYPVPVTMQTLIVLMIGMSYGARLGGATILGYLAAGAAGAPVFAGGAGIVYMMGTTGGYLAGFFISAVIMGLLAERGWGRNWMTTALAMLAGSAIIYLCGVSWLSSFIGLEKAVTFGLLPFIYGDLLKLVIAAAALPMAWSVLGRRNR